MQQPLLKRLIHNLIMRSCPAVFTVFLLPLLAVKPLAYIMINPTAADIEHHPYFHHPETTTHQLFSTSESISLEHIQDIINQMVHSMPEDTRHQAMLRKRSWFDGVGLTSAELITRHFCLSHWQSCGLQKPKT